MVDVPKIIAGRPAAMTILILLVTAMLGAGYLLVGGEMEADEETFMPSNEVVEASNEIGRLFTTSELVQVLVKSNQDNVLAPESLVEMLTLEKALSEDENISEILLDEGNPLRISSVADTIYHASGLLDIIEGMASQLGPEMAEALARVSQAITLSNEGIRNALGTPGLGDAVIAANRTIIDLVTQLMQMGSGFPLGPSGSPTEPSGQAPGAGPGFDEKIAFFENMTAEEVRELIADIVNYDESFTDSMVVTVNQAIEKAEVTVASLRDLNETLLMAAQDPSIVANPNALLALGTLRFTLPLLTSGVSQAAEMAAEMNIETTEKQLDAGMVGRARGITMSLTKDFSPQTGVYEAKGTMIILGFNATLARGEGEGMGFGGPHTAENESSKMLLAQERMVELIDNQKPTSTKMVVIGMELTSREILQATQDSFTILLPAAFLLIVVVLALVYRNVLDMVISLMALGFAIVWTYGIGALAGFVFNPMTLAVPVVIVGLGIDYGIHLTLRYKEERGYGETPHQSAVTSINWVGSALLIATITTLVAFASNLTSELAALKDFGILLAIGISSAFVIMVTFVPSVRQILDRRSSASSDSERRETSKRTEASRASRALGAGATAAEHHPGIVIVATLLVTALALYGATQLETRFELEDFLPEKLEYSAEIRFALNEFNVTGGSANVLIQGDLTSPTVLKAIEASTLNMADDELVAVTATTVGDRPDVDSIVSLMADVASDDSLTNALDLYDEQFAQLFQASLVDGDQIPDEGIEALFTWLYENQVTSATTRTLLYRNPEGLFDSTVMRIGLVSENVEDADQLLADLTGDMAPMDEVLASGELTRATITGASIMIRQITSSLQDSLSVSFVLTLIASFAILTVVFFITERSLALGAITMIPVLLSSAWILGSMYLMGIPYTVMTVMITALTVGLGVTYGIHLTHRFVEELREHGDVDEGCMETVVHTGSALFGAAATTVAGFGLLVFSLLPPVQEFGEIVALTIIYSFLTTVFILPTFLVMWAKRARKNSAG